METRKISIEEAKAEFAKVRKKGQWKQLAADVLEDGVPRTVTGLKRGQVAAAYRGLSGIEGIRFRCDYKNLKVTVAPTEVES